LIENPGLILLKLNPATKPDTIKITPLSKPPSRLQSSYKYTEIADDCYSCRLRLAYNAKAQVSEGILHQTLKNTLNFKRR